MRECGPNVYFTVILWPPVNSFLAIPAHDTDQLSHGRVVREYNVSMDINGSYTKLCRITPALDRNNRLIDLASYTGTKTTVNVINHHAARNCNGAEVVSHSKYSVFFWGAQVFSLL